MSNQQSRVWDKTTDVVVIGYGFAGAVSALRAHDLGAKVVVIEKQSRAGGLSIFAGGGFRFAENSDSAFKYLRRTCLNTVPDDVLQSAAVGFTRVRDILKPLLDKAGISYIDRLNTGGTYPFEGGQTFGYFKAKIDKSIERYPWLHTHGSGWIIFKLLEEEMKKRSIEVLLNTRLMNLVVNENRSVIGCETKSSDGNQLSVKARKAVILACGGFEQNDEMKLQFIQGQPVYADCPSSNEGDGIKAATLLGAKLWHMWHVHGSYGFKRPEFQVAFRHRFGGGTKDNEARKFPWILVDKFGRRYMNEQPLAPQDTPWRDMMDYDTDIQDYPRIPSYLIFNDLAIKGGPMFVTYYTDLDPPSAKYEWSTDNAVEIQKGWIKKGESIESLAEQLSMPPSNLAETLESWNAHCHDGKTDLFHRPAETMAPIDQPPFYAVEVWPVVTNTQGGIAHDSRQRAIDSFDRPIPHLYVAGQLGSIFGHLYLQAGNAAEAVFSGHAAAENAAKELSLD